MPRLLTCLKPWMAVSLLLGIFWWGLVATVAQKSATFDEPGHALGGYTYWRFGDFRFNPENGNLPQRVFALPLLGGEFKFPELRADTAGNAHEFSFRWFHRSGNDAQRLLWRGRLAASGFAVALALMVWACARQVVGAAGAWVALLACVTSPTVLANGALMTADTAAALFFLVAVWGWWRLLHRVAWGTFLLSGVGLAGVCLAKMSAPLALGCIALLTILRLLGEEPLELPRGRRLVRKRAQVGMLALVGCLQAEFVYGAIWAAYDFRFSATPPASRPAALDAAWEEAEAPTVLGALEHAALPPATMRAARGTLDYYAAAMESPNSALDPLLDTLCNRVLTPAQGDAFREHIRHGRNSSWALRLAFWAREHRLLPEAFLLGYVHAWRGAEARVAFLKGERSQFGWRTYFPFVFAVKTPLATLALLGVAAAAWIFLFRRDRGAAWRLGYEALPLLVLVVVYATAAIASRLNIGHRHLLPLYPALYVLCGVVTRAGRRVWTWGAWVLLAGQGVEICARFPDYLSYFNGLVHPAEGYRYVSDSSVDWGQDLPALREYLRRRDRAGPVYFSYFGVDDPKEYGIEANFLPSNPGLFLRGQDVFRAAEAPWAGYETLGPTSAGARTQWLMRAPGSFALASGTYVISATQLTFEWTERAERLYRDLQQVVEPFLAADAATRYANLQRAGAARWGEAIVSWEKARFAKLAANLRDRKPAAVLGGSLVVYQLSADEIASLLAGGIAPVSLAQFMAR